MNKIVSRLFIFLVGVPIVFVLVYFLPYKGHLALNTAVIIFSILGALEFRFMLEKKQMPLSKTETVILGGLTPALMTLVVSFNISEFIIPLFFITAIFWMLASAVFMPSVPIEGYLNRVLAGIAVLIYPGFLLAWICAMGNWDGILILLFLLIAMLGDSTAWLTGMLFGKNNRGIIKVSPNKSIAGFAGSLFASVLVSVAAVLVFPSLFVPRFSSAVIAGVVLGLVPGIAAIIGDLCESAMKRSADVKDSGAIIPGRGGVLDSVDSIALAAPFFYFTCLLLFTNTPV